MGVGYFHTQFMNILGIGLVLLQVQLAVANGTVTKPGGTEPLSKATVILSPVATGQTVRMRSAVTEDDGRFTIRDIEPGDYRLTAQNPRYGHTAYGQRKPGGPGTILSISAGQQISDLRLSMIPTGTIAGRVTGRSGEPLVYAAVQAFKYVYQDGRKILTTAQTAMTDDRGEYRLFWLAAGQYYVAAAAGNTRVGPTPAEPFRPGAGSAVESDSLAAQQEYQLAVLIRGESFPSANTVLRILEDGTVQEEAWAPVYYPAATEPRLATEIAVAAGTTRAGVDIVIGPERVQRVRGRVVGFTPGSTPTVTLLPQDTASGLRAPLYGRGSSTVEGSFEFTGVLPGSYYVVARDLRTGVLSPPLLVQVGSRDVDNLTLGMAQAIEVTGRVLIEGVTQNAENPNPLAGVIVGLQPDLPGGSFSAISANPAVGTGAFVWTNLAPGDYQVHFVTGGRPPGTKPLYLKSARLGLTDVTAGLHIAADTNGRVEIVLTTDPGSVEGVVIGSRGSPAANATVVLVPNVGRKRSNLYRSVVTGADGRFRFPDLTPGDYKLFAWDDVETGAWQNADFIRLYESKGLLVHLPEKSKEDVQLNVIYNP